MAFILHCYSSDRVEISSDSGQQFAFYVVPTGKRRCLKIDRVLLRRSPLSSQGSRMLRDAMRFAQLCAKDCGLA